MSSAILTALLMSGAFAQDGTTEPPPPGGAHAVEMRDAAQADRLQVFAWAESGVDAAPSVEGTTELRAIELVGVNVPINNTWDVEAHGAVRMTGAGNGPDKLDVYRLSAAYKGADWTVSFGRLIRYDSRGIQRIDGAIFDLDRGGSVSTVGWIGRVWHVETWDVGNTWVGGFQVALRPGNAGRYGSRTRGTLGWEGRAGEAFTHRFIASLASYGLDGRFGTTHFEIEPLVGEPVKWRAGVKGTLPVSRHTDAGVDVRWEGLPPLAVQNAVRSPMDWLAPQGYGVASAFTRFHHGDLSFGAEAGPTWYPHREGLAQAGGLGRAHVGLELHRDLGVSLYATAGAIGGSWLGGGGVALEGKVRESELSLNSGLYRFQGLDGMSAPVWESRAAYESPLWEARSRHDHLDLSVDAAMGTTRMLIPWVRGGLTVRGVVDRRRRGGQ